MAIVNLSRVAPEALLECTVPSVARSKVACGKSALVAGERCTLPTFAQFSRRRYRCYERSGPRPPPMNRRRAEGGDTVTIRAFATLSF